MSSLVPTPAQSQMAPELTMANPDITPDQIVHLSDTPKLLFHDTRNDSHQVSTTRDPLEQLPNIYPADVLTNRNKRNTDIAQSVPLGAPQIVSSYFEPTRPLYTSNSRRVPTTTPGKNTIPSMLDIVNAGYQRRINNRPISHLANRY